MVQSALPIMNLIRPWEAMGLAFHNRTSGSCHPNPSFVRVARYPLGAGDLVTRALLFGLSTTFLFSDSTHLRAVESKRLTRIHTLEVSQ